MHDIEFLPSSGNIIFLPGETVIETVEVVVEKTLYWLVAVGFIIGFLFAWLLALLLLP